MQHSIITGHEVLPGKELLAALTDRWLARLKSALTARDERALGLLFIPESYWRDALAFT
jgi:hypothetical protein